MKNKIEDLPTEFYWKFKSNIVDHNNTDFIKNFKICCGTYKDWEDWSTWQNGRFSSEYNHALDWLWENNYIYVLPKETFDNFVCEDAYNYDTKKYELTGEDYKWIMELILYNPLALL